MNEEALVHGGAVTPPPKKNSNYVFHLNTCVFNGRLVLWLGSVSNILIADPSGPAVYGVGLRPLACWDCGFESHRGHGYRSVVSVVCCQVEVSATS